MDIYQAREGNGAFHLPDKSELGMTSYPNIPVKEVGIPDLARLATVIPVTRYFAHKNTEAL